MDSSEESSATALKEISYNLKQIQVAWFNLLGFTGAAWDCILKTKKS